MDGQALALFDFDGTLIAGDTIVAYVRLARRQKRIGRAEMIKILFLAVLALSGCISDERAKQAALAFRMRMDNNSREAFDRTFVKDELVKRLFPKGVEALCAHARKGDVVLICSASPECYLQYIAKYLPVHAVLATRVSESGMLSDNCKGAEKPRRIHAWLLENNINPDYASSFAYGDSGSDIDMLRMAGTRVCVNMKKRLRKQAIGSQYRYLTW